MKKVLLFGGTGLSSLTATKSAWSTRIHFSPFHSMKLLVLVPRLALHVAAVAVVQDAAVARPAERPLGVQADAGLVLGVAAAQRLLCRVERSVVVVPHTGVDPHRASGGTVGAQLGVALEQVGLRVGGIGVALGAGRRGSR